MFISKSSWESTFKALGRVFYYENVFHRLIFSIAPSSDDGCFCIEEHIFFTPILSIDLALAKSFSSSLFFPEDSSVIILLGVKHRFDVLFVEQLTRRLFWMKHFPLLWFEK